MKARRDRFRSRSHKEIIISYYGNGTRALTSEAGKGKNPSIDANVSPVKTGPSWKGRKTIVKKARPADATAVPRRVEAKSVGNVMSIDAIVAPAGARTKDITRLDTIQSEAVVSSLKLRSETSVLATEPVASPTGLPELSASPSGSDSPSLRDYRRSPRPASLDHGRQPVEGLEPGAAKADSGRVGVSDTNDVHHRVATATSSSTCRSCNAGPEAEHLTQGPGVEGVKVEIADAATSSSTYRSGNAGPEAEHLTQGPEVEGVKVEIADADVGSHVKELVVQLEKAGISEKKTESEDKRRVSLDAQTGSRGGMRVGWTRGGLKLRTDSQRKRERIQRYGSVKGGKQALQALFRRAKTL
jgi:hypothetical protein